MVRIAVPVIKLCQKRGMNMRLILAQIGDNKTVKLAVKELCRLIKAMDDRVVLDVRKYASKIPSVKNALWVGLDGSEERSESDRIYLKVENGAGIISGSNERSVLMAAYRFMKELGCRYLYPGRDGEKIPKRSLSYADLTVQITEAASNEFRGICIEGAVGYEHVLNTIEWLPKVGMREFFTQFFTPGSFFRCYYEKFSNEDFKIEMSNEDIDAIVASLSDEIEERGLIYHAVGHGWNCKPFGLDDSGWDVFEGELDDNTRSLLARINGKRDFYGGKPKNTQLCYSNPYVRERITDCIKDYCAKNSLVDYLHFWLADEALNHCECEECIKKIPTDFYVDMLNLLDEKLTKVGIDTKIVFLIYTDLLFAPEKSAIKNPDRFTLMFAPINRWYTQSYADVDLEYLPELPVYERNKEFPRHKDALNVAYLKEWQKAFKGDSFVFDYHLMWHHHSDPGYYNIARFLHRDMTSLDRIGLDGMISCQLLRSAFPTGLPQYAMAAGLWNKDSRFEDIEEEYFSAAFGKDGRKVRDYLREISDLFAKIFSRGTGEEFRNYSIGLCEKVKALTEKFGKEYILSGKEISKDLKYLEIHARLTDILADIYIAAFERDEEEIDRLKESFRNTVKESEEIIDSVLDQRQYCDSVLETYLNSNRRFI